MGVKRTAAWVYRDPRWPALRLACKRRDGWRCRQCGARGQLEVDHIEPLRTAPERAFDIENLQCLCLQCHGAKTIAEIGLHPISENRAAWRALLKEGTPSCCKV